MIKSGWGLGGFGFGFILSNTRGNKKIKKQKRMKEFGMFHISMVGGENGKSNVTIKPRARLLGCMPS